MTKRYESNKKQMIDWKIKFNALKDNLASTSVDDLSKEIEQWKETAEEMRESYEESIHSLTLLFPMRFLSSVLSLQINHQLTC